MATLVDVYGAAQTDRPGVEYAVGTCSIGQIIVFLEAIHGATTNTDLPALVTDVGHTAAGSVLSSGSGTWTVGSGKFHYALYEVEVDGALVLYVDPADTNAPSAWAAARYTPDTGEEFSLNDAVDTEDTDSSTSIWTNVAASNVGGTHSFGLVYFHCTTNWNAGDIALACSPHTLDINSFNALSGEERMGAYTPVSGLSGTVTWTATDSVPGLSETTQSIGINLGYTIAAATTPDPGTIKLPQRRYVAEALPYDLRYVRLQGDQDG